MSRDEILKQRWQKLVSILSAKFSDGAARVRCYHHLVNYKRASCINPLKRQKVNLMHIAICRLLEPYGFYEFDF